MPRILALVSVGSVLLGLLPAGAIGGGLAGNDGFWRPVPPPYLHFAPAIHDPDLDRIVSFGGSDGLVRNWTWELRLSDSPRWTSLEPGGDVPAPRMNHTAIHDPVRQRMIVFGGRTGFNVTVVDAHVWSLSLQGPPQWSRLFVQGQGPSARHGHVAAYDPSEDRMIVFGGHDGVGYNNDVWTLSLADPPTWSRLDVSGLRPPPTWMNAAIWDPVEKRLIIHGGEQLDFETWALTLEGTPGWSEIPATDSPSFSSFYGHQAVYDAAEDRMLISGDDIYQSRGVWALPLRDPTRWQQLIGPGEYMIHHWAVYDPIRDRMVASGENYNTLGDARALHLGVEPFWENFTPPSDIPDARVEHSGAYDSRRDRFLMFGGPKWVPEARELFQFDPRDDRWSRIETIGEKPPTMESAGSIYDGQRDRFIVCGSGDSGNTWALNLGESEWVRLPDAPALYGSSAVHDATRDRMLLVGGQSSFDRTKPIELWALALGEDSEWSRLMPINAGPLARWNASVILDPTGDRLLVYGVPLFICFFYYIPLPSLPGLRSMTHVGAAW